MRSTPGHSGPECWAAPVGDQAADVDEGIAPLVLVARQLGFRTFSSCEHQEGTSVGWISFDNETEARAFQRLAGGEVIVPNEEDYATASEASKEAGFSRLGMAGVFFPVGTFVAASRRALARAAR